MVQGEPWGLHGFFSMFRLACSNLHQETLYETKILLESYIQLVKLSSENKLPPPDVAYPVPIKKSREAGLVSVRLCSQPIMTRYPPSRIHVDPYHLPSKPPGRDKSENSNASYLHTWAGQIAPRYHERPTKGTIKEGKRLTPSLTSANANCLTRKPVS